MSDHKVIGLNNEEMAPRGDGFQDISRDIDECQRLLAFSECSLLPVPVSGSVGGTQVSSFSGGSIYMFNGYLLQCLLLTTVIAAMIEKKFQMF